MKYPCDCGWTSPLARTIQSETYIKEKISQQNNIIMHWLAYIAPHSRHHEIKIEDGTVFMTDALS